MTTTSKKTKTTKEQVSYVMVMKSLITFVGKRPTLYIQYH